MNDNIIKVKIFEISKCSLHFYFCNYCCRKTCFVSSENRLQLKIVLGNPGKMVTAMILIQNGNNNYILMESTDFK